MKTIQIIGRKNSGKTTYTCELIKYLKYELKKSVISFKHTSETYPVDKPNTDSSKHREAGADVAIFNTDKETGVYFNNDNTVLNDNNNRFKQAILENFDYKIIESKRTHKGKKFEIIRDYESFENSYYFSDELVSKDIIGIITDDEKVIDEAVKKDIPVFKRDEIGKLVVFSYSLSNTPIKVKNELRKKIKRIKKSYSIHDKKLKSNFILEQVEKDTNFISAKTIFIYWAMEDEVDTKDFILKWSKQGKKIILPSVDGDSLVLKEFKGKQELKAGENFGILEPKGTIFTDYKEIDMAIIPGIAFDKNLNRMGRGKGYYDKILDELKSNSNCYLLGICFDFQIVENVPTEQHDIKMSNVISG